MTTVWHHGSLKYRMLVFAAFVLSLYLAYFFLTYIFAPRPSASQEAGGQSMIGSLALGVAFAYLAYKFFVGFVFGLRMRVEDEGFRLGTVLMRWDTHEGFYPQRECIVFQSYNMSRNAPSYDFAYVGALSSDKQFISEIEKYLPNFAKNEQHPSDRSLLSFLIAALIIPWL